MLRHLCINDLNKEEVMSSIKLSDIDQPIIEYVTIDGNLRSIDAPVLMPAEAMKGDRKHWDYTSKDYIRCKMVEVIGHDGEIDYQQSCSDV